MDIHGLDKDRLISKGGPQRLFVYGSLKRGMGNFARHLGEAKFLGDASIEGFVMRHLGAYPAIFRCNWDDTPRPKVHGEIFELTWKELYNIDILEGHPGHYRREEQQIYPFGWTWLYTQEPPSIAYDRVTSGTWQGHKTITEKTDAFTSSYSYGKHWKQRTPIALPPPVVYPPPGLNAEDAYGLVAEAALAPGWRLQTKEDREKERREKLEATRADAESRRAGHIKSHELGPLDPEDPHSPYYGLSEAEIIELLSDQHWTRYGGRD